MIDYLFILSNEWDKKKPTSGFIYYRKKERRENGWMSINIPNRNISLFKQEIVRLSVPRYPLPPTCLLPICLLINMHRIKNNKKKKEVNRVFEGD